MDNGKGRMERFSDLEQAYKAKAHNPLAGGIFHKGEIVSIKSSQFRITQILNNGLKLALIPKEEHDELINEFEEKTTELKKLLEENKQLRERESELVKNTNWEIKL